MVRHKQTTSSILFKELIRSIRINWKQFISVISISFLAVCLFCGLTSNAENLAERADLLYQETNYADLYITTSGLDADDLDNINSLEGVTKAEKRTTLSLTKTESSSAFTLIMEDYTSTLSIPRIVTGTKGFLVSRAYADTYGIKAGDTFSLTSTNYLVSSIPQIKTLLSGYVLAGRSNVLGENNIDLRLEVTGTMLHPEGVQNSRFSKPVLYTDYNYVTDSIFTVLKDNYNVSGLNNIATLKGYKSAEDYIFSMLTSFDSQILVNSSSPDKTLVAIDNYFTSKGEDNNLIIANKKESLACYQGLQQDIDQAMKLTFVFPVIFFLVSLLVILTTISQMIIKERMQIGSLKATGVRRRDIYIHYVSYGVVLTFIGSLLGFIIGPLFIPSVMNIKYQLLWDIPSLKPNFFYPMSLAIVGIMLLSAFFASLFVSYSVIREKPVETLRPKAPKYKKGKTAVFKGAKFRKLSSVSLTVRMALRNIMRNKMKTAMVIFGTLGCTALLVCGFGIMDTLDYDVYTDIKNTLVRDITLTPTKASEELKTTIEGLNDVRKVDSVTTYPVTISYDSSLDTTMYLMDQDNLAFSVPLEKGKIVIDKRTSERIGIDKGEQLKIVINGDLYSFEVSSIFSSSILKGIYGILDDFTSAELPITDYWVKCTSEDKLSSVKKEIEDLNREEFRSDNSIYTNEDYLSMADELLTSIRVMTRVVEIFAVLLSVVVIYNLTSLNITERTRDIATMKVLGFSYAEVARTLITEIMIDTVIGTLAGLPLGWPVCVLVMAVNKTDLLTFIYHIDWSSYLLAACISLFAALAVNLIQTLKTKKIKMVESLKSIE